MEIIHIILLVIYTCHACHARNITLLYEQRFDQQIAFVRNASKSSTTQNVNFLKIKNRLNLRNILDLNFSKEDVILSFIKTRNLIRDLFGTQQHEYYEFSNSLGELESHSINSPYNSCFRYTESYKRSIVALIYSIFLKDIAIITDGSYCSKQFLESVTLELDERENIKLNIKRYIINFKSTESKTIYETFYAFKTDDVRLLILLTPLHYLANILQNGKRFNLLGNSQLWLIPNYKDGVVSLNIPKRIMTFQELKNPQNEVYSNLRYTVTELLKFYENDDAICNRSRQCNMKSYLYDIIRRQEHTSNDVFHLQIHYRDLDEPKKGWINTTAEVHRDKFIVHENKLSMLRSVTGETIRRFIRVVTIFDAPYTIEDKAVYDAYERKCVTGLLCRKPIKTNHTVEYINTCCNGLIIEFFQLLIAGLNVDIDLYVVADGKYGAVENGRWNGIIGDVTYGKASMAVAGLTITSERSKVVGFTVPYIQAEMGIIVKPQIVGLEFLNWEFIAPLQSKLQLVLWFVIIGAMFINYILENNIYALSLSNEKYLTQKYYPTYESMTYIGGVTLQRDLGGQNPVRLGARVSAIVFAFGMVIVVTTYTAVLAAQSVQNQEKSPFEGSKDTRMRNPTDDFTFGTLKSSSYDTFFRKGETDVLKRMGMFMEKYNVNTTGEGVEKVKNGTLDAYIDDYQFLYSYMSRDIDCEIRVMKDSLLSAGYAIAYKKDLVMTSYINRMVLKLREAEELRDLQKKWLGNICEPKQFSTTKIQMGINHFGGLIILLLFTLAFCFPILFPEYLYYKYFRNFVSDFFKRCLRGRKSNDCEEFSKGSEIHFNNISNVLGLSMRRHSSVRKRSDALNIFL